MGLSSWVFLFAAVIALGYVVPHLVRIREVKVGSRLEDRFSQQLHLVAPESPPVLAERAACSPLHRTVPLEGRTMIRPTAPEATRVNARELAATRAARAAEISRRAAAARRRSLVLAVLGAVTLAVLAAAVWGPVAWGWAMVPGALWAGMAYLSVGATKVRRRADARARAEMNRLDQRLRLFRQQESAARAQAPTENETAAAPAAQSPEPEFDELMSSTSEPVSTQETPRHVRESAPDSGGVHTTQDTVGAWSPVPVPPPTYTLKQQAPRRSVAAYSTDSQQDEDTGAVPVRPTGAAPSSPVAEAPAALDVTKVLARRRAAGM